MDDINTKYLAVSQIIINNPILGESIETRETYIRRLKKYLKIGGWDRRKYEKSEMLAYEKIILDAEMVGKQYQIEHYKHFILLDLMHILGYEINEIPSLKWEKVKIAYYKDFENADDKSFDKIVDAVQEGDSKLANLEKSQRFANEMNYLRLIRKNIRFKKELPFGVMVTATMSAGKSTFINALVGKYICLSQNMACTSKIHTIINKAFEDGYEYEYDHDLVMTAGKEELLNDNEQNISDMIYVSTCFNGRLSDARIQINDSPGVNFSGDDDHKKITDQLIKRRKYKLLIYLMNSTQLGTNDEDEHLEYVKNTIGRTPILFVMNKVDSFNPEEEDIIEIINRQIRYLEKKGFKKPIVCPISARAAYLAKRYQIGGLTKSEEREMYNYIDKFEFMNLSKYYEQRLGIKYISNEDTEEKQLIKTSGFTYLEKIIMNYVRGEKAK